DLAIAKYQVNANFKTDASKKVESSIGILLNARTDGSGAIVCEMNSKNQYRVRKFLNGQWDILSFAGENGWNRDKAIKNKTYNEIMVKCENGIFDFYINSIFIFSFTDKKLASGNVGVFASEAGSGKIEYIRIFKEGTVTATTTPATAQTNVPDKTDPKTVVPPAETTAIDNEVVLLLKSKIDKQQKKITELTKEIEKCRMQKSGDTSLEIKNIELSQLNETLLIEKGKLEIELKAAKDKLAEYELLKKTLENDNNGDVILTLNDIINREKKRNQEMQTKVNLLEAENKQLMEMIKELQKGKK
ncbi:MAG: hypothetical protein ACKVQB_01210, partial [Bacteroidia bacterium]